MAAATTMPSTVGRKKKVHPFHIFKYVFLILASIISIFPFLWMIICATNDAVDINRGTVLWNKPVQEPAKPVRCRPWIPESTRKLRHYRCHYDRFGTAGFFCCRLWV